MAMMNDLERYAFRRALALRWWRMFLEPSMGEGEALDVAVTLHGLAKDLEEPDPPEAVEAERLRDAEARVRIEPPVAS